MNNGDQPIDGRGHVEFLKLLEKTPPSQRERLKIQDVNCLGLTKREHFASMAMQGLLSDFQITRYSAEDIIRKSLEYADELLKQLE